MSHQIIEVKINSFRSKVLVNDFMPVYYPNLYVTLEQSARELETQKKYLQHIGLFEDFLVFAKIDLITRLEQRPKSLYLTDAEITCFVSDAAFQKATLDKKYARVRLFQVAYETVGRSHAQQRLEGVRDYPLQKFDSDTERRFGVILERDAGKWFRPVKGQFQLYYRLGSEQPEYVPDFVVETADAILMCETKARTDMEDADVQAKAQAASTWCQNATTYSAAHGGKPWHYLLIPHDDIAENKQLSFFMRYARRKNPKDPVPYYSLGVMAEELGELDAAIEYYEGSVKADKNFEPGLYNLAAMYANANRFTESKSTLLRLLQVNPRADDAQKLLLQVDAELKKNKK